MTTDDSSLMHPWPENDGVDNRPATSTPDRGGAGYADLLAAERLLLDRLSGSALPDDVMADVLARLRGVVDILEEHQVPEWKRVDGWRPDLPGRGNALFPPYVFDLEAGDRITGRVTFSRYFLGGNAAAHGGAIALLFDDVLGRVANVGMPGVARTAFLKTNFRKVVQMDVELRFEVTRDTVDGRKRWCTGRLLDAEGALLVDVESLFLELRPGQQ